MQRYYEQQPPLFDEPLAQLCRNSPLGYAVLGAYLCRHLQHLDVYKTSKSFIQMS